MSLRIAFYPDRAIGHKINCVISYLGWEIVPYYEADLVFWWNYSSYYKPIPTELEGRRIINGKVLDTTKSFIEEYFEESTFINPEEYKGKAVIKYEVNKSHNMRVIYCPVKRTPGYVYQKILEQKEDDLWFDYRICWVFNQIPFVFKKYKSTMMPEGIDEKIVRIEQVRMDVFSEEFQMKFWNKMYNWCDYAEVDVLCEQVIDVNLIPSAAMFNYIDKSEYQQKVGEIFKHVFNS